MANVNFTIEQVTLKLKNGELLCQEKSGKSEVWLNFDEIIALFNSRSDWIDRKMCPK